MFSFIKVKRNILIFHSFIHVFSQNNLSFLQSASQKSLLIKWPFNPLPPIVFSKKIQLSFCHSICCCLFYATKIFSHFLRPGLVVVKL